MSQFLNLFRTPASTNEALIRTGRCVVYLVVPELTTTGTITLRDGATADGNGTIKHVCAVGLTQSGKSLGGVLFEKGLTVQLSQASDLSAIVWEPVP